jgi:hypothetical protein
VVRRASPTDFYISYSLGRILLVRTPPLAPTGSTSTEEPNVSDSKVWFITGAGGGMGAALAKAALADGKPVVATGRAPPAGPQA